MSDDQPVVPTNPTNPADPAEKANSTIPAKQAYPVGPNRHIAKEVSMYLVFGALTTAINLAAYSLLVVAGLHYGIATTIAFILAVLFAYETNKRFVFDSKKDSAREETRQVASFFGSRLATFGVETAGLVALIEGLGAGEQLSKYVMTVLVVILNYVLSKHFVFKKQ
jgi:putative flippase GtrA